MDYELIILFALVEIAMDEGASEHLKKLRIATLNKVQRRLNAYHHLGYIRNTFPFLLYTNINIIKKIIREKKILCKAITGWKIIFKIFFEIPQRLIASPLPLCYNVKNLKRRMIS